LEYIPIISEEPTTSRTRREKEAEKEYILRLQKLKEDKELQREQRKQEEKRVSRWKRFS